MAGSCAPFEPAACLARSTAAFDGITGGFGLVASAGSMWMAIEPVRQIASTPESSALPARPVFPVLPTRPPDVALEGVRIGVVPSPRHEILPQGAWDFGPHRPY